MTTPIRASPSLDNNGKPLKSWGSKGTAGPVRRAHLIARDGQGNLSGADRRNQPIQVFDNAGSFKTAYTNIGTLYAICITLGVHQ